MKHLLSCAFNMETACMEPKYSDGRMTAIDIIAVENEIADNMDKQSELDSLIYNSPVSYTDLILNGEPEKYLRDVTEYKAFEN